MQQTHEGTTIPNPSNHSLLTDNWLHSTICWQRKNPVLYRINTLSGISGCKHIKNITWSMQGMASMGQLHDFFSTLYDDLP